MDESIHPRRRYRPQSLPLDLDSANPQLASSFFDRLPRDIRLEIYTAFWKQHMIPSIDASNSYCNTETGSLNPRLVQHMIPSIYASNSYCNTETGSLNPRLVQHIEWPLRDRKRPGAHFGRWPCLLSDEALDYGNHSSSSSSNENGLRPDPADEDGPGDVDAAYADISDQSEMTRRLGWLNALRSRTHNHCEEPHRVMRSVARFGGPRSAASSSTDGLLTPLLVCKEMYREAAPLLYRATRFRFESDDAARSFLRVVPEWLRVFVRHVQISMTVGYASEALQAGQSENRLRRLKESQNRVSNTCRLLGDGFPHLQDLCITLHIYRPWGLQKQAELELPPAGPFYEPFYALAERLDDDYFTDLNVEVPLSAGADLASYELAAAAVTTTTRELERGKVRFTTVPAEGASDVGLLGRLLGY